MAKHSSKTWTDWFPEGNKPKHKPEQICTNCCVKKHWKKFLAGLNLIGTATGLLQKEHNNAYNMKK